MLGVMIMTSTTKTPTYADAIKLATKCHEGQTRKYSGDPYITHTIAVASKFTGEQLKIIAILHDVLEDTDMTLDKLRELGYPQLTIDALFLLTHNPKRDTYLEYILCVSDNTHATLVKIQDLKHNLMDLKAGHQRDKYELALWILEN